MEKPAGDSQWAKCQLYWSTSSAGVPGKSRAPIPLLSWVLGLSLHTMLPGAEKGMTPAGVMPHTPSETFEEGTEQKSDV